ncbi:MAG: peroxiredoxin [Proteobacteria bacterium]|nr:MAG: peroxiredoxin [Pseudomonadota bacterium]
MKLETTGGQTFSLRDLKGQAAVLYFYPRDNTPGCTKEGLDFSAQHAAFKKLKVQVFGISNDILSSHEKFLGKHAFTFPLVSDPEKELSQEFGVIKMKSMYGKQFEGIERSTFFLDEEGKIEKEWRKVKVPGHVAEVLAYARSRA